MTKAGLGKSTEARIQYWRARIAEQERSGMSVGRFCQEQQITEQSFYVWRKRLRQPEAVRFALVERGAAPAAIAAEPMLELVLVRGFVSANQWHEKLALGLAGRSVLAGPEARPAARKS